MCREGCIGGPWGGHHSQCPDSRECPGCEGAVGEDEAYCAECVEKGVDADGEPINPYALEPWDK